MIQKQKSQVKQYLSESFKASDWAGSLSSSVNSDGSPSPVNNLIPFPVLQHSQNSVSSTKSTPAISSVASSSKSATNYRLLNHINNRNNNNANSANGASTQSANDGINRSHSYEFSKNNSASGSTSSLPFLFRNGHYNSDVNVSPSEQSAPPMSPTISSVATSASEVSANYKS